MGFQQDVEAHHRACTKTTCRWLRSKCKTRCVRPSLSCPISRARLCACPYLNKKKASKGQDYGRNNPDNRTKRDSRWLVRPEVLHDGELIDTIDKWDMAMDPTSHLVQNSIAAVERGVFDSILGIEEDSAGVFTVAGSGIFGVATSGKRPRNCNRLAGRQRDRARRHRPDA